MKYLFNLQILVFSLALFIIDCKDKWLEISATGCDGKCPVINLDFNESNSDFIAGEFPKKELTELTFPDYPNWDIFSCDISKYSLKICLVKRIDK